MALCPLILPLYKPLHRKGAQAHRTSSSTAEVLVQHTLGSAPTGTDVLACCALSVKCCRGSRAQWSQGEGGTNLEWPQLPGQQSPFAAWLHRHASDLRAACPQRTNVAGWLGCPQGPPSAASLPGWSHLCAQPS